VIPVTPAKEPLHFDKTVRQRGLSAIDELVGRKPRLKRRGPRRKKLATREADIPADAFPPYWRDVLPDMLEAYERRCAYLALYFEHATGNPTIDHVLPKSRVWDQVYEWSNYRLCAALINTKKNDLLTLVDPFEVAKGWFALEFVAFQVIRGPNAPQGKAKEIEQTLLVLNMPECLKAREEYVTCYERGDIKLDYLERRAPFVASELRRQGRLRNESSR
jgi:5-methylcytosine-specific restriction endonuclease McrA